MRIGRFLVLGALFASGCERHDDRPIRAVVIGETPRIVDPTTRPLSPADAVLMSAAAQGLVRLDAAGQIVPGLAVRWSVSDDGLSYIFRLGDATWPDGSRVTARAVVRSLRAAAAPGSRNPLAGVLTGIEEILATNEVIEIRLTAPRQNLLHHLARAELGLVRERVGAGPFGVVRDASDILVLRRTVPAGEEDRQEIVELRATRAALGVTLFVGGAADMVLGGTVNDLPIMRAADPAAAALRLDPVAGLFGLAVVDTSGALASPDLRRALSMAVDREALVAAFGVPGMQTRTHLAGPGLSNLPVPAIPNWTAAPMELRRTEARRLVGISGEVPPLRVAMPNGPGYRLLFAHLRRDWADIGVNAVRVDMPRSADLRLVDAVAPSRGASWYLERFACARAMLCDAAVDAALAAARIARDPATRTAYFSEADRRLADAVVFIALTTPVRWSLVAPRAAGFRANAYGVHGLTDLTDAPRR